MQLEGKRIAVLAEDNYQTLELWYPLIRMREGCFGVCLKRAVPIGRPRLDAQPWAKYCIEAVREMEKQGSR